MSDTPDITAQMDQMGATLAGLAEPISQYYKAMVKAGLPEDLAGDLTMSFHNLWWCSQMGMSPGCAGG